MDWNCSSACSRAPVAHQPIAHIFWRRNCSGKGGAGDTVTNPNQPLISSGSVQAVSRSYRCRPSTPARSQHLWDGVTHPHAQCKPLNLQFHQSDWGVLRLYLLFSLFMVLHKRCMQRSSSRPDAEADDGATSGARLTEQPSLSEVSTDRLP
jgi:hypothetical protein